MAFYNAVDHRKPHARALTFFFGREKRIENMFHQTCRHAMPGIAHRQFEIESALNIEMFDNESGIEFHFGKTQT